MARKTNKVEEKKNIPAGIFYRCQHCNEEIELLFSHSLSDGKIDEVAHMWHWNPSCPVARFPELLMQNEIAPEALYRKDNELH